MIELLSLGIASKGFHFEFKQGNIKQVRIPSLNRVDEKKVAALFISIKEKHFSKFGEEFVLAQTGKGVKKEIDDFWISSLNLNIDMAPYYKMLSEEPIFTLKRL